MSITRANLFATVGAAALLPSSALAQPAEDGLPGLWTLVADASGRMQEVPSSGQILLGGNGQVAVQAMTLDPEAPVISDTHGVYEQR